ncbi:hypothetical protein FRB96_007602 [Tulasnella sp. 330]|nr:hypothetical protein FRB96_007602 [Tulasnella sp. 330]
MSIFLAWRIVFFVLLVLLNGTVCATAGLNLSTQAPGALRILDTYLVFLSAASILFLFPIILLETLKRGASTSKVWFECTWLGVLWGLNLAAAAITVSLSPRQTCVAGDLACVSGQILVAMTWISTLLLLCQFLLVMISSLYYHRQHTVVWTEPVQQFQWFRGGGTDKSTVLNSGPPSPTFPSNPVQHLERMAVRWQPESASAFREQKNYARNEPQPLTFTFAPELPPARAPTHYKATANVSVGVPPSTRKSSKRNPSLQPVASSLYPTSVQIAIDTSSERQPPSAPISSPPLALDSQTQSAAVLAAEPLPVTNWPRANPQEPYRPRKAGTAYVSTAATAASTRMGLPNSTELHPSLTSSPRNTPRGPRHRPAPLDLTAALPTSRPKK